MIIPAITRHPALLRVVLAALCLAWPSPGAHASSAGGEDERAILDQWEESFRPRVYAWERARPLADAELSARPLTEPPFPWLPGEDRTRSASTGTATDGFMWNTRRVEDSSYMRTTPRHLARGLQYGGEPLLRLLDEAARRVAARYPGTVTWLGNLGRDGGGDIPWSVSHASGRDADIVFFMTDPSGNPVVPPGMLSMDDRGRSRAYGGHYRFDLPRNWAFVEALVGQTQVPVQYVFVSNGLRELLLQEGRRQGADPHVMDAARRVMRQPGPEIPHDDHYHLRVFCSAFDVSAGCVDTGLRHPWSRDHREVLRQTEERALAALRDDDPAVRRRALERLRLIGTARGVSAAIAATSDPSPWVRAEAVLSLGRAGDASARERLFALWETEDDGLVLERALRAIGDLPGEDVDAFLLRVLGRPDALRGGWKTPSLALVALDAIGERRSLAAVPELLRSLEHEDRSHRARAAAALRNIVNDDPVPFRWGHPDLDARELSAALEGLHRWLAAREGMSLRTLQEEGFRRAGYDLRHGAAAALAEAAGDERLWIRTNAQRWLMDWSGNTPRSLQWSRQDARRYWVRWVRRNPHRFR